MHYILNKNQYHSLNYHICITLTMILIFFRVHTHFDISDSRTFQDLPMSNSRTFSMNSRTFNAQRNTYISEEVSKFQDFQGPLQTFQGFPGLESKCSNARTFQVFKDLRKPCSSVNFPHQLLLH